MHPVASVASALDAVFESYTTYAKVPSAFGSGGDGGNDSRAEFHCQSRAPLSLASSLSD